MRELELKNICKKLKPILGRRADALWTAYATAETPNSKYEAEALINLLAAQYLSANVGDEPILLPPPSPDAAAGEFLLGTMSYGSYRSSPLYLRRENFIKHIGIFSITGGGKTNVAQLLLLGLLNKNIPFLVVDWKISHLKRGGDDPRRRLEVSRSFNSALRHCKSLFSPQIINQPNFRVKIPRFRVRDGQLGERDAYWFETLKFERAGSMKFHAPAGVTYAGLIRNARSQLRAANPEAYKLFLLCLCAGMRRAEADVCLWSQLNIGDNSIRIEANEYIEPKHGSGGTVYVDPALMKELLSFREQTARAIRSVFRLEMESGGVHAVSVRTALASLVQLAGDQWNFGAEESA